MKHCDIDRDNKTNAKQEKIGIKRKVWPRKKREKNC